MDHNNKNNINSSVLKITIFFLTLISFTESSIANPQDGTVVAGSAIVTQQNPTTTVITQSTDKAIINWRSFNIGAGETTQFNQPSSNSIALNRVTDGNPTSILGNLSANGKIMLINPNGIMFGANSVIDVASFTATTSKIDNQDFLKGHYRFIQDPTKNFGIVNNGTIKVSDTGLVALVAPSVVNNGIIQANLGKVILASGMEFTMIDPYGDKLIQFAANSKVNNATVANHGTIIADGGTVLMTAQATANMVENVISMDGIIQARSIAEHNGEVILAGNNKSIVSVNGEIDTSGKNTGERGGKIKITGNKVGIFNNAKIDASGANGGGKILIGGNKNGRNSKTTNAKYVYVSRNANISADAITNNNGGKVIVWSDNATQFYGNISAHGGSQNGDGGFVEVSGKQDLFFDGLVDTSAPLGKTGTLLLDPKNITIKETGGSAYNPNVNNYFIDLPTSAVTIKPSSLASQTSNVLLQANTDITITDAIAMTTPGVALTMQAGRSILIDNNISTQNGAITLIANDSSATLANRTSGVGNITMQTGTTLDAGNQNISLTIDILSGGNPGSITANNLTTNGGNILINSQNAITLHGAINSNSGAITINANLDSNGANNFTMNGGSSITTTNGPIAITVNTATGGTGKAMLGNITTQNTLNVTTNAGGAITQNGILNVNNIVLAAGNSNDITLSQDNSLNSVGITSGHNVTIKNATNLDLATTAISSGLTVTANGTITQSGTISAKTLTTISKGGTTLNAANTLSNFNATNSNGGDISLTNTGALTTTGINQTGGGNIVLSSNNVLSVANGTTINSGNGNLSITATNLNLNSTGTLNSGTGNTVFSGLHDVGLGNATGTMQINHAKLQHIQANNLTINAGNNSNITVDGVTTIDVAHIGSVTLNATQGNSNVVFKNASSTLQALTVNTNTSINIDTNLSTSTGNLTLNGSILLDKDVTLTTNNADIIFNGTTNGAHNLTLGTGTGNIYFNANIGNITPLLTLQITNANNVTNNATINTTSFIQKAGTGTTALGNGLNTTNATSITTNNVIGAINVSALTLDVNTANLTGKIDGASGLDGAKKITLFKTIQSNTQFFDGIDLSGNQKIVEPTLPNPAKYFYYFTAPNPITSQQLRDKNLVITIVEN